MALRTTTTSTLVSRSAVLLAIIACGCSKPPQYGKQNMLFASQGTPSTWAVAPAINLSGQPGIDPLIQADVLYQKLQEVRGITVVPVNRVVELMVALRVREITSSEQARVMCEQLGVDALVVPTITVYSPYDPPRIGASLQVFLRNSGPGRQLLDPRELARQSTPDDIEALPLEADFIQAADIFDSANGSTRDALMLYAAGRTDPLGPLGAREYYLNMNRYSGFVWHELVERVLRKLPQEK